MNYNNLYYNDNDIYDGVDNVNGNIREHMNFLKKIAKAFETTFTPNASCNEDWGIIRDKLREMAKTYSDATKSYDEIVNKYNSNIDEYNKQIDIYNTHINYIYKLQEIINSYSKDDLRYSSIRLPTFKKMEPKNKIQKTYYNNINYAIYNYTFRCKVYKTRTYSDTIEFYTTTNGFPDASYNFSFNLKFSGSLEIDVERAARRAGNEIYTVIDKIKDLITKYTNDTNTITADLETLTKTTNKVLKLYKDLNTLLYDVTKDNMKHMKYI